MASILMVEDDLWLARSWTRLLAGRGHRVCSARTLKRARKLLAGDAGDSAASFDLVLLDLRLPDGDGAALLPAIHRLASPPAVAVVSAYYDSVRAVELHGHITAGIPKPVPDDTLCAFVEALLRARFDEAVEAFGEHYGLTAAETMLLKAAANGLSTNETVESLDLSVTTVHQYWQRIFAKTGQRQLRKVLGLLFRFAVDRKSTSG